MPIHPELKYALDAGVSTREVIRIFIQHHCGAMEERIDHDAKCIKITHSDYKFWDTWRPLFRRLTNGSQKRFAPSQISVKIHKSFTREIISWLCDSKRHCNVYLIAEPSASAVYRHENYRADVLMASICSKAQRFGRSSYDIYSLINRLAIAYPPYRRVLTRILVDNPDIRKLPLRTHFKKLIHEPWKALQEIYPRYVTTPPGIVIRWDARKQTEELFRAICELGSPTHSSPLLWIISVNPEYTLPIQDLLNPLVPFYYFRLPVCCFRLPVCFDEIPGDTAPLLRSKFDALRLSYHEVFEKDEVWPSEEQMSKLTRIVSGVFDFVGAIIRFVDWKDDGGPRAHLETFLAYMVDPLPPQHQLPFRAFDQFYRQTLSNIHPDILFIVKRAMGIILSLTRDCSETLTQLQLVCLLSLGNDAFFPQLKRLADSYAFDSKISCSYLGRFLEDPNRSGRFHISESESRLHAFQASLYFLTHSSDFTTIVKPQGVQSIKADQSTYSEQIEILRPLACSGLCQIRDAGEEWVSLLRGFDFRCLAHICDNIHLTRFIEFIKHLYAANLNIVRVEPTGPLDRQFVDKCEGLAGPFNLEGEWPLSGPKYILLGYDAKTVLAVLASRGKYRDNFYEDFGVRSGVVTIYTSTMLDDM